MSTFPMVSIWLVIANTLNTNYNPRQILYICLNKTKDTQIPSQILILLIHMRKMSNLTTICLKMVLSLIGLIASKLSYMGALHAKHTYSNFPLKRNSG